VPVVSPFQIVLTDGQRRLLLARARRASGEHRDVLAAADGVSNAAIARPLGVTDDTVCMMRSTVDGDTCTPSKRYSAQTLWCPTPGAPRRV
jgi:hypothetical protein